MKDEGVGGCALYGRVAGWLTSPTAVDPRSTADNRNNLHISDGLQSAYQTLAAGSQGGQ